MQTKEQRILDAAMRLFHRHGYCKVCMSDIAEAAAMSRPTLYASFPCKEAIYAALVKQQCMKSQEETAAMLARTVDLKERLIALFEIWIVGPVTAVLASENATDMLANCAHYAPEAVAEQHAQFKAHLAAVLRPACDGRGALSAEDIAAIMCLATTSIKASAQSEPTLRYLVNGLVTMALATVSPVLP